MGQWIQIPTPPYWAYDPDAPEGDVSATSMLPVYAAPAAEPEQRTEPATGPIPQVQFLEPPAATAGEQDHTNPWWYAGEDADPPENP